VKELVQIYRADATAGGKSGSGNVFCLKTRGGKRPRKSAKGLAKERALWYSLISMSWGFKTQEL
jgi:hypothetical protein